MFKAIMVDVSDIEFTPQQVTWLRKEFTRRDAPGFDRATIMWIIGGLTAIGIVAFGAIWNEIGGIRGEIDSLRGEIGSVRGEIGSVRGEIDSLREEVKKNRARIADLANSLTRIEAILEERLPRN